MLTVFIILSVIFPLLYFCLLPSDRENYPTHDAFYREANRMMQHIEHDKKSCN